MYPPGGAEFVDQRPLFMNVIHDAFPVKKYYDALTFSYEWEGFQRT